MEVTRMEIQERMGEINHISKIFYSALASFSWFFHRAVLGVLEG